MLTNEACVAVLAGTADVAAHCSTLVRMANENADEPEFSSFSDASAFVSAGAALLCMLMAGLAAGLTMGVVSLDHLDLRIKERGESAEQRIYAKKLLPLIQWEPRHQLLVTLLLLNSVANEALPLFLDQLVPPWCAIIISVTAVLFVGEILPSAIFTGPAKLQIAARLSGLVWVVMALLSPLAFPLGWALDKLIPEHETLTSRAEVRALVDVQRELAAERGLGAASEAFNEDEADLVRGALSLSGRRVVDVMVPMEDVFALPASARLDRPTLEELLLRGHSRVPIYPGPDRTSATAFLHLKDHLLLNPADATSVTALHTHSPIWVGPTASLFGLLNSFQEGHAHMAFVSRHPELASQAVVARGEWPMGASRCIGIITLEDILEEILTEEIYDESDLRHAEMTINDFVKTVIRPRLDHKRARAAAVGAASMSPTQSGSVAPEQPEASGSSPPPVPMPPLLSRTSSSSTGRWKVLRGKTLAASSPPRAQPEQQPVASPQAPNAVLCASVVQPASLTAPLLAANEQHLASSTCCANGASL